MFPKEEHPPSPAQIRYLAELIEGRRDQGMDNEEIPAGYTYLGQFIDHDITFDPTPANDAGEDAEATENFRTPRLDLDSLYGAGPAVHPFLYDRSDRGQGIRMLVEKRRGGHLDVPRNSQGRAIIGDTRNDDNVIVSQIHLLFLRFHNAVLDRLAAEGVAKESLFEEARREVRWHFQWLVLHDFLERVVGRRMARAVLRPAKSAGEPATVRTRYFGWRRRTFMPVEFSVGAFRFGHSIVRPGYQLQLPGPQGGAADELPVFARARTAPSLRGRRPLPKKLVIHWPLFFHLDKKQLPQLSFTMDASLPSALFALPDSDLSLAQLNLLRARKLRVPSGQAVARAMKMKPISAKYLELGTGRSAEALAKRTPLWYYALCENCRVEDEDEPGVMRKHTRLGPVAGRIVAEVLVGLVAGDHSSYLAMEPDWQPRFGHRIKGGRRDFTMPDLIRFVEK